MNLRSLEQFLDEIHQEGQLESHGEFTLDWARALEKLGKYQSEAPGLWLVKALQAAVASGSESLKVTCAANCTSVQICPGGPLAPFREALKTLQPAVGRQEGHLQLAVHSLCSIPDVAASISFHEEEVAREYLLEGAVLGPRSAEKKCPPGTRIVLTRRWNRNGLREYFQRVGLTAGETLFLQEMGRFAPLAIRVDNRLLNDPVVNKPPGLRLGVFVNPFAFRPRPAIPYATMERIVFSRDGERRDLMAMADHSLRQSKYLCVGSNPPLRAFTGPHAFCQQWLCEDAEVFDLPGHLRLNRPPYSTFDSKIERAEPSMQVWADYNRSLPAVLARGYLSLDLNGGRPGRLYVIKDGVSLKHMPLGDAYPGCLVIWSEPSIRSDLSQLQVVADEVYEKTLATVYGHLRGCAELFLALDGQENPSFFNLFQRSHGEVPAVARGILHRW